MGAYCAFRAGWRPASPARPISHAPAAESTAPVTTGQIVDFDGGPGGGPPFAAVLAPQRSYSRASTSPVTSAAQPAIAVNEAIPGTTRRSGQCEHRRHRVITAPAGLPIGHARQQISRRTLFFGTTDHGGFSRRH